ncbi:MAG TPA: hypothetical protein VM782_09910, partial [Stellaceae bacterium]|nr:hypothetical protein [Stellaceae bacterium]
AAAGIREQHNRSARPVKGAFERRAADVDVSVLLQSHLRGLPRSALAFLSSRVLSPVSLLALRAQSVLKRAMIALNASEPAATSRRVVRQA